MFRNKPYDVIVLGGGIAGLTHAILLAQQNIRVLCLDKKNPKSEKDSPFHQRTTALSYGSAQLFRSANLWDKIEKFACPIQTIHVKDGTSDTLLTLEDKPETIFGWVLQNGLLIDLLTETLKNLKHANYLTNCDITEITDHGEAITLTDQNNKIYSAALLIGADGRQSFVRQNLNIETDAFAYDQNAIVAIVTHQNPHGNIAVEHFRQSGPFAILPMIDDKKGKHRSSIVWTEEADTKTSLINMTDETFFIALQEQLPSTYGEIFKIESRFSYPLGFIHAHDYIGPRTALIGDAAHGIHPIAGQGLNLGLRDVSSLCELIIEHKKIDQDLGSDDLLNQYQDARRADNTLMAIETDQINRLFSSRNPVTKIARKIGLKTTDQVVPLKQKLIQQMMGLAGNVPRFIRDGKI